MKTSVVPDSPFAQTVAALVAAHGLEPIELRLWPAGGALAIASRRRIHVGTKLLKRPPHMQQWTAAHEVAHIALDHRRPSPTRHFAAHPAVRLRRRAAPRTRAQPGWRLVMLTVAIVVYLALDATIAAGRRPSVAPDARVPPTPRNNPAAQSA